MFCKYNNIYFVFTLAAVRQRRGRGRGRQTAVRHTGVRRRVFALKLIIQKIKQEKFKNNSSDCLFHISRLLEFEDREDAEGDRGCSQVA